MLSLAKVWLKNLKDNVLQAPDLDNMLRLINHNFDNKHQ